MQQEASPKLSGSALLEFGRGFQSGLTRWKALVGLLAACFIASVAAPATALAASPTSAPANATGWIRFGDFVPSQGPVDVTLDNITIGSNLVFRSVTNYVSVPAGVHTVTVRSATAPTTAPPLVVGQADVPSGGAVTAAAVAASDTAAAATQPGPLKLQMYTDDLSAPPAGMARVRIIHTIPGAPAVSAQLTAAATPGSATATAAHTLDIRSVGYGQASPYLTRHRS
jgi:hypothetical protein